MFSGILGRGLTSVFNNLIDLVVPVHSNVVNCA